MKYVHVILKDHETGQALEMLYGPEDWDQIKFYWDRSDALTLSLQNHRSFAGYDTWAKLLPVHYKVLMAQSVEKVFDLITSGSYRVETINNEDVIKSFNFIAKAYIYCMEERADMEILLMMINRHDVGHLTYTFSANIDSSMMKLPNYPPDSTDAPVTTSPSGASSMPNIRIVKKD